LLVSDLRELPVLNRVTVNASMRTRVVFPDVPSLRASAFGAVSLLSRAYRPSSNIGKSVGINAAGLFCDARHESLLRADGQGDSVGSRALRQFGDKQVFFLVGWIIPGEA